MKIARSIDRSRTSGFTLVEMAVVLAVIGLILGSVMIGTDVLRNAEYAKIRQSFINQWRAAYNSYYTRTGVPVGDNQAAPQLMVNGDEFSGTSGGNMTNATSPGMLCAATGTGGASGSGSGGGSGGSSGGSSGGQHRVPNSNSVTTGLRDMMVRTGTTLPQGRGEGLEDRYVYQDTNGNPQELQVCFRWNPPEQGGGGSSGGGNNTGGHGSGNTMIIGGLTPDLARYLDQSIDGQADAREGRFRQWNVGNDAAGQTGREWIGNNSQSFSDTRTTSTSGVDGGSSRGDEEQVLTVTAVYQMSR